MCTERRCACAQCCGQAVGWAGAKPLEVQVYKRDGGLDSWGGGGGRESAGPRGHKAAIGPQVLTMPSCVKSETRNARATTSGCRAWNVETAAYP